MSDFIFTFHFHALEKEMATHSSVLAWRIPGMGKPGVERQLAHHLGAGPLPGEQTWVSVGASRLYPSPALYPDIQETEKPKELATMSLASPKVKGHLFPFSAFHVFPSFTLLCLMLWLQETGT